MVLMNVIIFVKYFDVLNVKRVEQFYFIFIKGQEGVRDLVGKKREYVGIKGYFRKMLEFIYVRGIFLGINLYFGCLRICVKFQR